MREKRRKGNKMWMPAAAAAAALMLRSEYEKKQLETAVYEISSEKIGSCWNGCSIVFLSDLHGNVFGKENRTLIRKIRSLRPQIILIGGDIPVVKSWQEKDFSREKQLFTQLSAICPVYYAMGNHEQRMQRQRGEYPGWWEEYTEIIEKAGILLLDDDGVILERSGQTISIDGLSLEDRYFRKRIDPKKLYPDIAQHIGIAQKDCFEILLAHSPLFLEQYAAWGADLVLSGHLHGGTIYLPKLGGLMTPQFHFFSPLCRGMIRRRQTSMIVSAGLGTHTVNLRLNNKPQLVQILLKSGK